MAQRFKELLAESRARRGIPTPEPIIAIEQTAEQTTYTHTWCLQLDALHWRLGHKPRRAQALPEL